MHIISESRLKQFWTKHANSKSALQAWYKIATQEKWRGIDDVRKTFPSADPVGNLTVFNIGGNNYRLITFIDYNFNKIFIRACLTHAEYDKGNWKKESWDES
ncbi:MAG: type II toxin-antitoxin system HigB family toxin [Chroococcales cyanobacterium]